MDKVYDKGIHNILDALHIAFYEIVCDLLVSYLMLDNRFLLTLSLIGKEVQYANPR